jgi:predicted ATPase
MRFPLGRVTALAGAIGVGKTSLYRDLELLHAAANGTTAYQTTRGGGPGSIATWLEGLGNAGGFPDEEE